MPSNVPRRIYTQDPHHPNIGEIFFTPDSQEWHIYTEEGWVLLLRAEPEPDLVEPPTIEHLSFPDPRTLEEEYFSRISSELEEEFFSRNPPP